MPQLLTEIGDLAAEDRRERLELVDQHQVAQRARREEERIALLQRHGRAELGLVVVVTQVGDLVQVAGRSAGTGEGSGKLGRRELLMMQ